MVATPFFLLFKLIFIFSFGSPSLSRSQLRHSPFY